MPRRLKAVVMFLNRKIIITAFLILFLLFACERGSIESTKISHTRAQIQFLEERLLLLKKDIGRYPKTGEGLNPLLSAPQGSSSWQGPYLKTNVLPSDAWGQSYIYQYPAIYGTKEIDLYSSGPNMLDEQGKGDDISNWQDNSRARMWAYFISGIVILLIFVLYRRSKIKIVNGAQT
jgi:general secretion pathway protein G